MKYSRYPSYKDSGAEWLGEIPSDWIVARNKQAFSFEKDLVGKRSKDYTLLSLTLKGIKIRDIDSGKGKFPAEFDTYQKVEKNDIVFCLFDIDETPRTVGISGDKGMITGAYNVARCNTKAVPEYIYYYYLSIDEYKGLKPYYTGLRKVVRTETFMNIPLALPSYEEQQTIANYLDKATDKIDTLIEKQTRLIELLKEKRQAVISTAVTRGLDGSVAMKDSGVEWLGEIPEGWEVKKLKYSARIQGGKDQKAVLDDNGEYPVYGSGGIFGYANKYLYNDESVLLGRKGTVDKPLYVQGAFWTVDTMYYTILENITVPKWFYYSATTIKFDYYQYGAAVPSMTQEDLHNIYFSTPLEEEQQAIADYLDKKTNAIDNLISKSTKAIDLLKEKRTALISAVVTGKIKVNDEVREDALGVM